MGTRRNNHIEPLSLAGPSSDDLQNTEGLEKVCFKDRTDFCIRSSLQPLVREVHMMKNLNPTPNTTLWINKTSFLSLMDSRISVYHCVHAPDTVIQVGSDGIYFTWMVFSMLWKMLIVLSSVD